MFRKILTSILCITIILVSSFEGNYANASGGNPSRAELEKKVEEVARKRGIPSVILKTIARVESVYKQFNKDGSVFTGSSGSIGIMQIHNKYGWFDDEKLKYDIDYNIEAGADVLLRKWDTALETLPQIGDMNPNVIENWYFAIWAYNGWSKSNNPNTGIKKQAFQDLVYYIAEKDYGQKITPISKSLLPKQGLPSKNSKFETPQDHHYGDILTYAEGDIVKLDGRHLMALKDSPNGSTISEVTNVMKLQVLGGPVLNNGYFWYKVKVEGTDITGWLVGNWISKTGSIYPFLDISSIWSKDYIIKLHDMGVVSGNGDNFNPDNHITRQEISVMISKALKLEPSDYQLEYIDTDEIKDWALEHVIAVSKAGIITGDTNLNQFKPNEYITREEVAIIISRAVGYDGTDIQLNYTDIGEISNEATDAIKNIQTKGIMNGAQEKFRPKDYLTREETCKIIIDMLEMIVD